MDKHRTSEKGVSYQTLKDRVDYLEKHHQNHHRHCNLLQFPHASLEVSGHEPRHEPNGARAQRSASSKDSNKEPEPYLANEAARTSNGPKIRFAIEDSIPKAKRNPDPPRWLMEAKDAIAAVPHGKEWKAKWLELGVDHKEDFIARVLGNSRSTNLSSCHVGPDGSTTDLINSLYQYAKIIKPTRQAAVPFFASFQRLVFGSVCAALQKARILTYEESSEILGLIVQQRSRKPASLEYLRRIRRGMLWVNQLIDSLSRRGWGSRAWQTVFLCEFLCFWLSQVLTYRCLQ